MPKGKKGDDIIYVGDEVAIPISQIVATEWVSAGVLRAWPAYGGGAFIVPETEWPKLDKEGLLPKVIDS